MAGFSLAGRLSVGRSSQKIGPVISFLMSSSFNQNGTARRLTTGGALLSKSETPANPKRGQHE